MLESFGVESANDVERIRLYGIPSIDPETVMELLQWRRDVEQTFVFNPEHGITLADVGAAKEMAVRQVQDFAGPKDPHGRQAARNAGRSRRKTI